MLLFKANILQGLSQFEREQQQQQQVQQEQQLRQNVTEFEAEDDVKVENELSINNSDNSGGGEMFVLSCDQCRRQVVTMMDKMKMMTKLGQNPSSKNQKLEDVENEKMSENCKNKRFHSIWSFRGDIHDDVRLGSSWNNLLLLSAMKWSILIVMIVDF